MGYSFWLAAKVLLYAPSHRQASTYHGLCYTSRGPLPGARNISMGPPWRIDPTTHRTMSERSYHGATSCSTCDRDLPVDGRGWSFVCWRTRSSFSSAGRARHRPLVSWSSASSYSTARSETDRKKGNVLFNDTLNTF